MKKQRLSIKVLFIILCALAIVGAFMAYRDNVQLSNQLGKIDNVEEKIDSLLNVERKLPQRVDCFEMDFFGILEPGGFYETVTI